MEETNCVYQFRDPYGTAGELVLSIAERKRVRSHLRSDARESPFVVRQDDAARYLVIIPRIGLSPRRRGAGRSRARGTSHGGSSATQPRHVRPVREGCRG